MSDITIYHNPKCGTSRNTLALIRNSGEDPRVVLYLETPPDKATLRALVAATGEPVRALLREKGTPYEALGLGQPHWSDEDLLDFMVAHPLLINRPLVVTPLGTRLCRPSERVLDLLPQPQRGAFHKEDGEAVIDAQGQRVRPQADGAVRAVRAVRASTGGSACARAQVPVSAPGGPRTPAVARAQRATSAS